MMDNKLEPCPTPWCDGIMGGPHVFTRRGDCQGVRCSTCCVSTRYFATEEEAIAEWNTRPEAADEITRLKAENAELRAALKPFAKAEITGTRSCPASTPLSDRDVYEVEGLKVSDFSRAGALITKASRDSGHG